MKIDSASLAALLDATRADPTVRTLSLQRVGLTANLAVQLADFIEANRSITALDLTGNAIGSHGAQCLAASLQKNDMLEQLTLASCGLQSDAVAALATAVAAPSTRVRAIDLSNNQIDDDAAAALAALVAAMGASVENAEATLDLRKNALGDTAMRALATAMQPTETLTTLGIDSNQDEDAVLAKKQIAFCAQRNRRRRARLVVLQELQSLGDASVSVFDLAVEYIELTLADAALLSDGLRTNRSLLSLRLRDNALASEGTRRILCALLLHPSLTTLKLHDNETDDACVAALSCLLRVSGSLVDVAIAHSVHNSHLAPLSRPSLASLHHTLARDTLMLRRLALVNCGFGDVEAGVVASGIAWACCLESLDVHNNPFTDHSVHVLKRLVVRCQRLQALDVSGSRLTLDGALVLAQAAASHPALRGLTLGRFPLSSATTLDAIVAHLGTSETLVRVALATTERASRCAEAMTTLHSAWLARREAYDRVRRHHTTQEREANERRATSRTRVWCAAVRLVTLWIQQGTQRIVTTVY